MNRRSHAEPPIEVVVFGDDSPRQPLWAWGFTRCNPLTAISCAMT